MYMCLISVQTSACTCTCMFASLIQNLLTEKHINAGMFTYK